MSTASPTAMKSIDLSVLIPRCHEASKANGWWEPKPNAGQQLMLVVSELSEALEADRNGKRANMRGYLSERTNLENSGDLENSYGRERMLGEFRSCIKDSVEDELADAYIRLCDFAGGFACDEDVIAGHRDLSHRYQVAPSHDLAPENFGAALFQINQKISLVRPTDTIRDGYHLGEALAMIARLCAREGIDLATHIDLKLAYNATRGQKHGGKRY